MVRHVKSSESPDVVWRSQLVRFFEAAGGLPAEDLADLEQAVTFITVPKRGLFIEPGRVADRIGFALKGLVKFHHAGASGVLSIVAFAREGDVIADYESILTGEPAMVKVEAIEDTVLAVINKSVLHALMGKSESLRRIYGQSIDQLVLRLIRRERKLLTMTAVELYKDFCVEFRPIFGRISEQDKAAYIGVTPVSLSRLTAKLRKSP